MSDTRYRNGMNLSCGRCHVSVLMPLTPDGAHIDITPADGWEIGSDGALCPKCAVAPAPTPPPSEPPVVTKSRRFTFTCECGYRPTRPVTLGELQDLKAIHGTHGIRNRKGWKAEEVVESAASGGGPSEERLRAALETIAGPQDRGSWIEVYRAAGGGYEGLQAIARTALQPPDPTEGTEQ